MRRKRSRIDNVLVVCSIFFILMALSGIVLAIAANHGGNSKTSHHNPTAITAVHRQRYITLEVFGTKTSTALVTEGQRHVHSVDGPFKITLPLTKDTYGITDRLLAEASANGDTNTPGHLTATILIDGKVIARKSTTADNPYVVVFVYKIDGKYTTSP